MINELDIDPATAQEYEKWLDTNGYNSFLDEQWKKMCDKPVFVGMDMATGDDFSTVIYWINGQPVAEYRAGRLKKYLEDINRK